MKKKERPPLSWPMLVGAAAVIFGFAGLLGGQDNSPPGGVMESLGRVLVMVVATLTLGAVFHRKIAPWMLLAAGAMLFIWQGLQTHRVALREEVTRIVRHLHEVKRQTGRNPDLKSWAAFERGANQ